MDRTVADDGPDTPAALKLLEPQLDSCNARLIGEVASGKLPFLNLPSAAA